tara:strand:+ start:4870 stop:5934 length:1065 start_codon:yes stop_codon:yes gene_type:complete
MSERRQPTELYVGLFVILGIILLGWMIVHFGKFGSRPDGGYPLHVEVNDATGIREGVPVSFGGVQIGYVASPPSLSEDFTTLSIELRIYPGRKIPIGSDVKVGKSGLMGDSFIRITPPLESTGAFFLEGAHIEAGNAGNLGDLAGSADETLDQAGTLLKDVGNIVEDLDTMFRTLEKSLLNEGNIENVNAMLTSLRNSAEQIEVAAGNLNPLLMRTEEAVLSVSAVADNANNAFGQIELGLEGFTDTLDSIDPVLAELDGTLNELRSTLANANDILEKIDHGNGLSSALINDAALRNDITDFVDKLNRNGFLFYPKESAPEKRSNVRTSPVPSSTPTQPQAKKPPFSWLKRKLP